jgi:hypothetical protein
VPMLQQRDDDIPGRLNIAAVPPPARHAGDSGKMERCGSSSLDGQSLDWCRSSRVRAFRARPEGDTNPREGAVVARDGDHPELPDAAGSVQWF